VFLVCLCAVAVPGPIAAQSETTGSFVIDGRLIDVMTGEPLPGAEVSVNEGYARTATGRDGRFRIVSLHPGMVTVKITYLGRPDWTRSMTAEPGAVVHLGDLAVGDIEENVLVTASLFRDAEERALNQQKAAPNIQNIVSADQIGSFPDRNAAETTQRVPGISISKDQGEGRDVSVRGTEARLNAMMIDGQRIPSPDPLLRQVAVDVIPSELLQAIEVSKALTPDVDADSIGGSVNLVTKQAPDRARFLGSHWRRLQPDADRLGTEQCHCHGRTPFHGRGAGSHRILQRVDHHTRQSGHRGDVYAVARPQRTQSAVLPGEPAALRSERCARFQACLIEYDAARHL